GEPAAEKALKEPLAALGKLVLDPLVKHVGDKERWIVSPDSLLWLVPWSVLPVNGGAYAIEKHDIQYVVSGRDLLMNPLKLDRKPTAPLILADPDFDLEPRNGKASAPKGAGPGRGLSKDFKLGSVGRLPGTATEAEAIRPRLEAFTGARPKVFTDRQAVTGAF